MGFFKLKSPILSEQAKAGDAIIRVSNSVFQQGPTSEWAKFNANTRKWLFDNGYTYDGTADGMVPPEIDLVPVYDTPTKMHVRIPWAGDLVGGVAPVSEPTYGGSFPAFLARYFMRHCR